MFFQSLKREQKRRRRKSAELERGGEMLEIVESAYLKEGVRGRRSKGGRSDRVGGGEEEKDDATHT